MEDKKEVKKVDVKVSVPCLEIKSQKN